LCRTYLLVGVNELCSCVLCKHVENGDLPPLIYVNQEAAQLAVILVDEVYTLRANCLKCHYNTACYKLGREGREGKEGREGREGREGGKEGRKGGSSACDKEMDLTC